MFTSLCLCLWLAGILTSQGEVVAPSRVRAAAGRPVTLACNVTMVSERDRLQQVHWVDGRGRTLLAYTPGLPPSVMVTGVEMVDGGDRSSGVTIVSVGVADEGCYRCVFNIFPSGSQEGETCLSVTGEADTEGNQTVVSGRGASLSCRYGLPEHVLQVLWRKTSRQGKTVAVGSYSERGGLDVDDAFRGRLGLSASLGRTELDIAAVATDDEGCYTCEFHAFPDGAASAVACLSVHVLPQPEVSSETSSSGVTEANCSARSRPPTLLMWQMPRGGANRTLGPAVTSSSQQGDGTTLVTSTLLLLDAMPVTCVAQHPGLDAPIYLPLHSNVGVSLVVLIFLCIMAVMLLVCLCAYLCKFFVCVDD